MFMHLMKLLTDALTEYRKSLLALIVTAHFKYGIHAPDQVNVKPLVANKSQKL